MFNATPLLRVYAKHRNSRFASKKPIDEQRNQLFSLIKKAARTSFGNDHGFEKIRTVKEYQERVPLRRYEDFWDQYWKSQYPNLVNCTWPGKIAHFAVSSGTSSGATKYIPCSREMINSNTKAGTDLIVHHITNCPQSQIFGGKIFLLGGSTDFASPAPGVFTGDLSGIAAKTMPWWVKPRYFPPQNLALLKDWEEKIETLAQLSLSEDIRMISGVPAWLLLFFDRLDEMKKRGGGRIASTYPNLELLVHGGVNFAPYHKRFQEILKGSSAELREVYPASEGFIASADRGYGDGLKLNLDVGIFFEFVPLEELSSSNPRRHTVEEVQTDINYAVVLTTCAGLWSYILGDTVRFVDTKTPRVLVTGRTSYYLSAFGEHLIAEEIESSVATAAKAINHDITDYTVGPVFPERSGDLGGHVYIVEFTERPPTTEEISKFSAVLDEALCRSNEDYEAHRANGFGLQAPMILVAKPGCFTAWMKSRGKLGGQHKVPRIMNDNKLLQDLMAFVAQY